MYEPKHFKVEDRDELFAILSAHPLGILISADADGVQANPVPFTRAKNAEGGDVLRCHLARPNPQWQHIAAGARVLVVFQGGDHYVTPNWYPAKKEHGKAVPTWNYVHIQVEGKASVHENAEFLMAQISALTDDHEAGRAGRWSVSDAPEAYIAGQMRGIVGVEIAVETISGKFKLSQNRSEADFNGVVAGLASEADLAGPAMSAFIAGKSGLIRS